MATDDASEELKQDLANPSMSFYGRVREAARNVAIKCKMMCKGESSSSSSSNPDGDCKLTENE